MAHGYIVFDSVADTLVESPVTHLAAVVEAHEATKDDVTLRVIAQYLQVLYCTEMVSVAQSQADLAYGELRCC